MLRVVATESTAERALLGAKLGREDLEAGITTVRDLGNSGVNGDVALRRAFDQGWLQGPRMVSSTRALAAPGGQFGRLTPAAQNVIEQEYRGQASLLVYEAYAQSGMTPMETIHAATRDAAELLGMQKRVGTLEKGKMADVIAVPGDPLQDVKALEQRSS